MLTRCSLLVAFPLFLATAGAQPAVVLHEYPVAVLGSPLFGPTAGPIVNGSDGALWFPVGHPGFEFSSYQIFRITTAGVAAGSGSGDGGVGGITAGPDGALWYTNYDGGIWRLTTSGVLTSYLPNASASAITTGPDGALWFTGSAIGRITTSGAFTQYPLPTAGVGPRAIAAGSDGALWFTENWFTENSSGMIGRITTSGTTINEYPVSTAGTLTAIAAGPDGALWFVESTAQQIGRITTGGAVTEYPVPMGSPQSIAAGPDGAVWFTAGAYIGRITTAGVVTEYPVPVSFSAAGITAGSDGAMWFTASNGLYFEIGQAVINPSPVPAILTITETHTGNFSRGQTNAVYTLTVSNQQAASPTSGLVTVTDTLAPGLSLISMAGAGWNCTGNSCTRSDTINGGGAYPPITVLVDVAANAGSPQVNGLSVSGGGSGSSGTLDSTIITIPPLLSIAKTHTGTFDPGQMNAVYTLTVSNRAQGGPTYGTVTVTEMPTAGLTVVSMAGAGWTCAGVTCTRSDVLNGNASYPAIAVMVNVAANASSPQVNQASVSGGGAAVTASIADWTILTGAQPPSFFAGEVSLGSGVYYLTFLNNTLFGYYEHLPGSFIYHYDMGFEYVLPANDALGDVYFYDFRSGHWWYTGPELFPNLYDFTLAAWIYYLPDPSNPGHYTNLRTFVYDTLPFMFLNM